MYTNDNDIYSHMPWSHMCICYWQCICIGAFYISNIGSAASLVLLQKDSELRFHLYLMFCVKASKWHYTECKWVTYCGFSALAMQVFDMGRVAYSDKWACTQYRQTGPNVSTLHMNYCISTVLMIWLKGVWTLVFDHTLTKMVTCLLRSSALFLA